ncbi:MAG: glycosyltransferase [Candidatus Hadarchaeaceae archaeon]
MPEAKYQHPEVSIIVPTYNERENLPMLAQGVSKSLKGVKYELIIVDDNSPDGTGKIADELAKKFKNFKALHRREKKGLATAVVYGLKHAYAPTVCVMDADLQHPPEKIPELLTEIKGGADIAIASRYVRKGDVKKWGKRRRFISRGAEFLSRLTVPRTQGLTDPLSGFFAFKQKVISNAKLNPVGFKILLEILVKGTWEKIAEVPYVFGKRVHGKSSLGFGEHFTYLRHLLRLMRAGGESSRLLKFCLVGASGVVVNLGLLWILTEIAGLFYLVSAAFSIETSILSNFVLNELWTFRDRTRSTSGIPKRASKFNLIGIVGFVINLVIIGALTELLGMHYMISALFGIAGAMLWNYVMSAMWTWRYAEAG